MNERQRDLFLYLWSRRRAPGQMRLALRGAIIGALGGVLFALMLASSGSVDTGGYTGLSVIIPMIERAGKMLFPSVGAFGALGFILTSRIYAAQERMYQNMLAAGAQAPAEKPQMQMSDRGPALAVAIAGGLIALFIVILFVMYW